jgi:hypothetical protein
MQDNNKSVMLANLRMLEFVAMKLGEIRNDVVFLGGCTTGLFITDFNRQHGYKNSDSPIFSCN